jgi:hypothetical protein
MTKIAIFRTRPQKLDQERFTKLASHFGIEKKIVETEEALAVHDSARALAYAQPGSKFGGLLFFTDQTQSLGDLKEKPLDLKSAQRWSDEFLREHKLIPQKPEDPKIGFHFETSCTANEAVVFDGKERKKNWIATDISAAISLNGIPAGGPRAKVRMVFKGRKIPLVVHCAIWDKIEVFEERELVGQDEVMHAVKEKLAGRKEEKTRFGISNIRLSYFAREYEGGPDLLAPYYFMDVEFEDRRGKKMGIAQGPRQMFWVPACR